MSNLDNLVSKINRDSEEKANSIISEAKANADRVIAEKVSLAEIERDKILAEGKRESEMAKSQIVSGRSLEVRDGKLQAKQDIINKIFQLSVEKLNELSKEDYVKFLENYLTKLDIEGNEQIVFPEKYSDVDLNALNEKLKASGKKGELSILETDKKIKGGFIIAKEGIENNNTFEALLDFYREGLESEVVSALF